RRGISFRLDVALTKLIARLLRNPFAWVMPPMRTFRFTQKENGLHKQTPVSRRPCRPVVGISLSHFRNCLDRRGFWNRGLRGFAWMQNRKFALSPPLLSFRAR